jgi:hypothetical protein
VKARTVALGAAVAGAVAGLVWWRRLTAVVPEAAVQLGTSDGAVHDLDEADPSRDELVALAAGVRDLLTGRT